MDMLDMLYNDKGFGFECLNEIMTFAKKIIVCRHIETIYLLLIAIGQRW